jgi:Carboxypeptidase regulatory-like domain
MRFARLIALLAGALTALGFQAPAGGTLGTVAGRVIEVPSSESDKGIRKALVILKRGQEPGIGVYSDDKGNYRLQAAPGAYSVTVECAGYVASSQSQPKTIVVQGRQALSDINLELIRAGVISGRVVDSDGDPMPQVSVQLRSVRERKPASLGAVTDDRGVYRIYQIPPGKYYLSGVYQPAYQVREIQMQASDALEESYVTTYYPGTFDLTQARSIDIAAGADLAGLDLQLQRVHAVHIRGRVSGIAGPLPVVVMVQPQGSGFGTMRNLFVRNPNGEFDLSGIPPGKYELSASALDLTNRGAGPSAHQKIEADRCGRYRIDTSGAASHQGLSSCTRRQKNSAGAACDSVGSRKDQWASGRAGPSRFGWSIHAGHRAGR